MRLLLQIHVYVVDNKTLQLLTDRTGNENLVNGAYPDGECVVNMARSVERGRCYSYQFCWDCLFGAPHIKIKRFYFEQIMKLWGPLLNLSLK